MKKVAIQGIVGSFHDITAHQYFKGEDIELICCDTFEEVFENMKADSNVVGIVAIENTIAGSLLHNYELLRESGTTVVGEHKLHIEHSLLCLPEDDWDDITEVNSHPVALMQCRGFQSIEDNKHNFTRFLVCVDPWKADEYRNAHRTNKSMIVFSLPHTEGSLSQVLSIFSFYNINLTKIQSLPIIGREWEYLFYVDVAYSDYVRYHQAIDAITPLTKALKILGEYEEFKSKL